MVIEAIQLTRSPGKHGDQIFEWRDIERQFGDQVNAIGNNVNGELECIGINIKTLEGTMLAMPGDWIITGVKGEVYPCKPDIFAATYDPA